MSSNSPTASKRPMRIMFGSFTLAAILVAIGLGIRSHHANAVAGWTEAQAIPTVITVPVRFDNTDLHIELPASLAPWTVAPIYARVSGYLQSWRTDIGAHVQKNDILGVIDSPDLDQEIAQARNRLGQVDAQAKIARTTAARWQHLLAGNSVSQQDADEKNAQADALLASRKAAQADYDRLRSLGDYKFIRAPFDGVVTARKTDIGQLIHADNSSGRELFRMAALHKLRLLVPIPQAYVASIHPGMTAEVTVPEKPGKRYTATLMSTSESFDSRTGTLTAQFEISNTDKGLLPGGYASVSIKSAKSATRLSIPSTALMAPLLCAKSISPAILAAYWKWTKGSPTVIR